MLSQAQDQLAKLLREEEIKLYQRAKVNDVLLGDNNMKYFQMIPMANIGRNEFSPWIVIMK
jgi:hypothetical protein